MSVIKKEIEIGKELSEIVDLVAAIIVDIKAKKDIATIAAENLPALMVAVQGFDQLVPEAKEVGIETALYAAGAVLKAIKG